MALSPTGPANAPAGNITWLAPTRADQMPREVCHGCGSLFRRSDRPTAATNARVRTGQHDSRIPRNHGRGPRVFLPRSRHLPCPRSHLLPGAAPQTGASGGYCPGSFPGRVAAGGCIRGDVRRWSRQQCHLRHTHAAGIRLPGDFLHTERLRGVIARPLGFVAP